MKYYVSKTDNKGNISQLCFATRKEAYEYVQKEIAKIELTKNQKHSIVGNTIQYENGYMIHYSIFEELTYDFC